MILTPEMDKRFFAVLNKKIEIGKAMNALGHMTAGLVGVAKERDKMGMVDYVDKDGTPHIASKYPFIILKAKNSNQIRTLRTILSNRNIPFSSFHEAMTVGGYEEQLERSKQIPEEELEYYGICFFADADDVREFTGKFSLYQ